MERVDIINNISSAYSLKTTGAFNVIRNKSGLSRAIVFCTAVLCTVLLSGCAGKNNDSISPENNSDNFSVTETQASTEADSETENIRRADDIVYEYETRELYCRRDENNIYGVIYVPENAGEKMPAVIFSHGFGGNYQVGTQYAEALAQNGYVVYCFDFCGGSPDSRSDGSTLEMSIFTEQQDLEAVLGMIQEQPFVDKENIFLMGTSQGGVVSAITAAAHKEEIKGAILLYPAFVLVDNAKEMFESVDDIPETYYLLWMTVGRAYAEKLLDYDIYGAVSEYDRDVLLLHGDADSIVPLSYSEKAAEIYPSAQLEVFPGAGHGFYGEDAERAIDCILEYLSAHCKNVSVTNSETTETTVNSSYESAEGRKIIMITENTEVVVTLNEQDNTGLVI